MNRTVALSVAFAALVGVGVAAAQTEERHHDVMMFRGGHPPGGEMDTNHDGWLSRDEASAAADRIFADLDSNHDGRLTPDDHPHDTFDVRVDGPPGDHDCDTNVAPPADGDAQGERRVTVICRTEEDGPVTAPRAEHGEQHVEREVHVMVQGAHGGPGAPDAPRPPHPPMFMMLFANSEEADTNGDGALSRDEFRAQHMRFFDASDVNGDGKVRFDPPPEPPAPPAPPEAPRPPRPPAPPHN